MEAVGYAMEPPPWESWQDPRCERELRWWLRVIDTYKTMLHHQLVAYRALSDSIGVESDHVWAWRVLFHCQELQYRIKHIELKLVRFQQTQLQRQLEALDARTRELWRGMREGCFAPEAGENYLPSAWLPELWDYAHRADGLVRWSFWDDGSPAMTPRAATPWENPASTAGG